MFNYSLRTLIKKCLPVFIIITQPAQETAYPSFLPLNGGRNSQTSSAAASQTENDALITQLSKNKYKLSLEQGRLIGDAADLLIKEARNSQFFLIAEDHGIAESAEFTAALFRQINPYGYTRFAIEAGPVTARLLEKLAASEDAQKAFAEFNRQNPFSAPFYFWKQEARLLETVVKSGAGKGESLWGLDQEFIMSAKLHLKRLAELAPDKQSRQVVDGYYQSAQTEFRRMVESKNPGLVFMASAKEDDFKRLETALRASPGSEAAEILREMKESWEIYGKTFRGLGYESNVQRTNLMKRHFMRYYNEAARRENKPPRVLFKFGVNHIKRGRSYVNAYDIGTLVPEMASASGTAAFQLLLLGAGGTQNSYLPFLGNDADKNKKYDVVKVFRDYASTDVTPFLTAAANDSKWVLLDLRPLRPLLHNRSLGKIDKGIEEMIWGFDAILVIPEIHAATLFDWE